MEISADEFSIPFFKDNDFIRLECPICKAHYWTQNPESQNCGDAPCQPYTFIGNPSTRKRFSLDEMRQIFLKYFEQNKHTPINPYPIVARWRDDVYLVGASIYNFQPYVTEGVIPPPANPLVVSQPCIRMTDLDLVGPTNGRHLTIFEMGGAHAFNFPDKQVYWKNETIQFHHELLTQELGVKSEDVMYKEHFWSGGGNAGPDVEACIAGLEISTLVFMKYKTSNGELIELPIKTVDTGYGIERWMWLSQGSPSGFHAIYAPLIEEIAQTADVEADLKLIAESTRLSSRVNLETVQNRLNARKQLAKQLEWDWTEIHTLLTRVEEIYAITDHTKALAFILSEGIIPSNVEEGYLARLLTRRTLRMLQRLNLDDDVLLTTTEKQIHIWGTVFPQLNEMRQEVLDALTVETEKYRRTLEKGIGKLSRIVQDLTKTGQREIPDELLIQLYDSHGLDPDTVKDFTQEVEVHPPEDFYSRIAQKHLEVAPSDEAPKLGLESKIEDLPPTKPLYYDDPELQYFTAQVLAIVEGAYVILDQTVFYPESGGQVADNGTLTDNGTVLPVVDVQKVGNIILHKVEGTPPPVGSSVEGTIDWERRLSLTRHHTATHILIGAVRRLFGDHAWQAGARKDVTKSRLDITHYRHLTPEDVTRLEEMAFTVITQDIPVEALWMPRNEAESQYGFRIYQGGAVPGRKLRIIKVGDWDVEACGGTHCQRTGQVGLIKILHVEHPQDGMERLIFATGRNALQYIQETYQLTADLSDILNVPQENMRKTVETVLEREKTLERKLSKLIRFASAEKVEKLLHEVTEIKGIKLITAKVPDISEEEAIEIASQISKRDPLTVTVLGFQSQGTARIITAVGEEALSKGLDAGEITKAVAPHIRGGGGGKPYFGQAGGSDPSGIGKALTKVEKVVEEMLQG